jgi:hypothetical protein
MNAKDILQFVGDHLLEQNKQARDPVSHGACMYRTLDGKSCAVGCLLKDEYYTETLEGRPLRSSAVHNALVNALNLSLGHELNQRELNLLVELQYVHDVYEPVDWPHALRKLGYAPKPSAGA